MSAAEYDVASPVAGFTGEAAGVAFTDGHGRTSVLGAVQYFRRHGYTVVPAGDDQRVGAGGGVGSGSGPDTSEVPARSAKKAAWVAHAAAVDPDATDLDTLTKEQLIDRYGSGDGQD